MVTLACNMHLMHTSLAKFSYFYHKLMSDLKDFIFLFSYCYMPRLYSIMNSLAAGDIIIHCHRWVYFQVLKVTKTHSQNLNINDCVM